MNKNLIVFLKKIVNSTFVLRQISVRNLCAMIAVIGKSSIFPITEQNPPRGRTPEGDKRFTN